MKEKGAQDEDEDDLAMGDNRTGFLISEFKPDLYQLAVGGAGIRLILILSRMVYSGVT